ncbi:MAG: rod shape-determining protein MreC [Rikenellaceae bacterium]
MIRLLLLLRRALPFLLYLVIALVCLNIFFSQNAYQRARLIGISHSVLGGVHAQLRSVSDYFSLGKENETLLRENARLRAQLSRFVADSVENYLDHVNATHSNEVVVKVVNNTYTKRNNFITIAGGELQGVATDMALYNGDGIVGYVKYVSDNFAVAVSVLNCRDFRTSGMLSDGSVGSIVWDAESYYEVVMNEIPAHAVISIGDTVTTTEFSNIFPSGIGIGVVESFEKEYNTLYTARLRLLADITKPCYLYATSPDMQLERFELENATID